MRGASGSRLSGTRSTTKAIATRAMGSLARKVLPHQYCSSSAQPVMGPKATARPVLAPHSPMALARATRSRNTWVRIDKVVGKTAAAPMPVKARAAISCPGVSAKAARVLPSPKIASPTSSTARRPNRSDRLPPASTSAANTSR